MSTALAEAFDSEIADQKLALSQAEGDLQEARQAIKAAKKEIRRLEKIKARVVP